jgi:hypothetical protein
MSNVEDILAFAWNKDADNLKTAVSDALVSRTVDTIADMSKDVAASMFGNSTGEDTQEELPLEQENSQDEGTEDEAV